MNVDDLLGLLKETKSLHDEADILHYLYETKGLEWEITTHFPGSKLKDLIAEAYEKASKCKIWWLVRHSAGMLGMRFDELAQVKDDFKTKYLLDKKNFIKFLIFIL